MTILRMDPSQTLRTSPATANRAGQGKLTRHAFITLLVVGLVGLVWHAERRVPCAPAVGTQLCGLVAAQRPVGGRFRVGTFNIHGGKGVEGQLDLDRTASCLAGMDLIALQEVHGPWLGTGTNQAESLGKRLGLPWVFGPSVRQWHHYDFGNAVLTSLPVEHWQVVPLPTEYGRSYQNLILCRLRHQQRDVQVIATHIQRRDNRDRESQLRAAISLFLSLSEPAILLGDLNTSADDPQLKALLSIPGVTNALAASPAGNGKTIDWIITRGFRVVSAQSQDRGASDHPCLSADLEFSPH